MRAGVRRDLVSSECDGEMHIRYCIVMSIHDQIVHFYQTYDYISLQLL